MKLLEKTIMFLVVFFITAAILDGLYKKFGAGIFASFLEATSHLEVFFSVVVLAVVILVFCEMIWGTITSAWSFIFKRKSKGASNV